ncbi:hypothetical protein TorRG33x02_226800, partial [Trema orientale]
TLTFESHRGVNDFCHHFIGRLCFFPVVCRRTQSYTPMQRNEYPDRYTSFFYGVNPSDVRKQQGRYALAFAAHEVRFKDQMEKLQQWRNSFEKSGRFFRI